MYFQNLYTLFHIVCVLLQCLLHSILFSRFIQMNRWRSNLFPLNDGMQFNSGLTEIKPESPVWQVDSLPLAPPRKSLLCLIYLKYFIIHKRGNHEKQFIVKPTVCQSQFQRIKQRRKYTTSANCHDRGQSQFKEGQRSMRCCQC